MNPLRVLVADDDKNICELLNLYLSNEGFDVVFAHDGSEAINVAKEGNVDIILLDIMLPVINGWEVCKIIRKSSQVPIIMITARDMVEDKVNGFELGADDYIVKPFEPKEVIARVRARIKGKPKSEAKQDGILNLGNVVIDINKYEVRKNDCVVELKPKEIQLLYFLVKNKNIVFSREQLLEKVWEYEFAGDTRTVDVHVKRLREKLEEPGSLWSIKTVWGVGYKLEVE